MSNKSYGLQKERELKHMLLKNGAIDISRCRGSLGNYDLVCFFPKACLLISVKAVKTRYFGRLKSETNKIREDAVPEYCRKILAIYFSPNAERTKTSGWKFTDTTCYMSLSELLKSLM